MKNITESLPDDVYRKARVAAAERDSSVSALVREFLTGLAAGETDFARRARLQDDVLKTIKNFKATGRLSRDQVHERRPVR